MKKVKKKFDNIGEIGGIFKIFLQIFLSIFYIYFPLHFRIKYI